MGLQGAHLASFKMEKSRENSNCQSHRESTISQTYHAKTWHAFRILPMASERFLHIFYGKIRLTRPAQPPLDRGRFRANIASMSTVSGRFGIIVIIRGVRI